MNILEYWFVGGSVIERNLNAGAIERESEIAYRPSPQDYSIILIDNSGRLRFSIKDLLLMPEQAILVMPLQPCYTQPRSLRPKGIEIKY